MFISPRCLNNRLKEDRIEILSELRAFNVETDGFPFAAKQWLQEIPIIRQEVEFVVVEMKEVFEEVIIFARAWDFHFTSLIFHKYCQRRRNLC